MSHYFLPLLLLFFLLPGTAAGASVANSAPSGEKGLSANAEPLSYSELLKRVMAQNQYIQSQQVQWDMEKTAIDKARAIFEPAFVTSVQLADRSQRNTAEERASRGIDDIYAERNWNYSGAVQGLLPTGAIINVGYDSRRISNTLTRLTDNNHEYKMFLGVTLTQPLLKNAGVKTTKAGIHVAEADAEVAFYEYRQEAIRTVGEAAVAYWNFYQAQERLRLREDSLRIAEEILKDNTERFRLGKMAETEALEAMVGVVTRRSLLREARQEHLAGMNNLRTLFSLAAAQDTSGIEVVDKPSTEVSISDADALLKKAFLMRPEYLAILKKVDRAGIKVTFAKNQLWPELDLKASYGLNGLDSSKSDAWEQIKEGQFDEWTVGLNLKLPLLGNMDGTSEHQKARLDKKRAMLFLKVTEVGLINDIATAVQNVRSVSDQVHYAAEVVGIQQKLLDAEMARVKAGKSNTRLVLEKEMEWRKARETELKSSVDLQTAVIGLEMATGSILANNGIDFMEVDL